MMEIRKERLQDCFDELLPLLQDHFKELEHDQHKQFLNVDLEKYLALESVEVLQLFVARENGIIVGYASWLLVSSIHSKHIDMAYCDVFYICPSSRGIWLSMRLLKECESQLKEMGATSMVLNVKLSHNWGKMLERNGFEPIEISYQKWIGD